MASKLITPRTGRLVISDGAALSATIPYTNGDFAESGDTDESGYEREVVYCRDDPMSAERTKRSGKKGKFTALATTADAAVTLEDIAYKKSTWASPTSTAASVSLSNLTHYQLDWQVLIGVTWTSMALYKYCLLTINRKEGSPAAMLDVDVEAIAYDDNWRTVTTA